MKRIGIGVIGSGRIGRLRTLLLSQSPQVGFLAVSDIDPEKAAALAAESGADFHSGDNEAVLSHPDVDAVIVSTPENLHADPACRALELGKPILLEKPIALSLEDADRILESKRKFGGDMCIGYTQRARRRFLNAKELIRQGRLGRLLTARMCLYNPVSTGAEIYKRVQHASPVLDTLTYMVDIAGWYFEGRRPVSIYAQGRSKIFSHHPGNVGDWAWALLSYDDGTTVNFGCSWIYPRNWPANITAIGMEVMGEKGAISIDDSHNDVMLASTVQSPSPYVRDHGVSVVFLETMMAGDWALGEFWGPMRDETRLFLEHVTTGRPVPLTTPEEARTTLEITLGIEKSAIESKPVSFPMA